MSCEAVICGVHPDECLGFMPSRLSHALDGMWPRKAGKKVHTKVHRTHEEAYQCKKRYLVRQGYTPRRNREFKPPDGGPILVLDKKCRYGAELRKGKDGRLMPQQRHNGVII